MVRLYVCFDNKGNWIWRNSHLLTLVTKPDSLLLEDHRSVKSGGRHSKTVLLFIPSLISKHFTVRDVFKMSSACYKKHGKQNTLSVFITPNNEASTTIPCIFNENHANCGLENKIVYRFSQA